MPRNADGEFELVLGNKQLLSLFFLVAVLFAVFFSLGYVVGRSAGPTQTMAAQPPSPSESSPASLPPLVVEPPASSTPAPEPEPPKAAEEAPPVEAVTSTKPAASEPAASPPAPAAALVARELHLQIAAVRVREDAESLAESLRQKGYTVLLNTQTRDGWYRVLVGPFADAKAAQEMKTRLEKDGYKSILKRP